MSFILDALKKSESERQRQAGPALLEMRIIPPPRGLPIWAMVAGAVLLASVAVLGWLALRSHPAAAPTALHAAAPSDGTPRAASAPQASAAPAGAPQSATAQPQDAIGASSDSLPAAPRASSRNEVDASETNDGSLQGGNPADNEPAVTAQPGLQGGGTNGAKVRNYAEVSGTVPELRLDLHVYSANPAERYAFINMHKVREGDTTPEGAQVQQITRDGVVLQYNGSEFLLGRQ
ncbi:MAG: general secretion pathway protein GspB [Steroidobacteraceae bacterium]